jgi:hypothetical protein
MRKMIFASQIARTGRVIIDVKRYDIALNRCQREQMQQPLRVLARRMILSARLSKALISQPPPTSKDALNSCERQR